MRSNPMERFSINLVSDPARGAVAMSCENAECVQRRNGWLVLLDPVHSPAHVAHVRTIEQYCVALGQPHPDASRRRFIRLSAEEAPDYFEQHGAELGFSWDAAEVARRAVPGSLVYAFPPGQNCFRQHWDRDVVFVHANPRGNQRVHQRPLDFNEDWNETAYEFERRVQRG